MLPFHDAMLPLRAARAVDLENIAFFGGQGGITPLLPDTPLAGVPAAGQWWRRALARSDARLQTAGLVGWPALGVPARALADRWQGDLWMALGELLAAHPRAIPGPVEGRDEPPPRGSLEEDALHAPLRLAVELDRPALLMPVGEDHAGAVRQLLRTCDALGVPPRLRLMAGVDFLTLRTVVGEGALACVCVGPRGLVADDAARLIVEWGPDVWRRVALASSGGPGAVDVLAIPKALRALRRRGLHEAALRAVAGGNLLGRLPGVPGPGVSGRAE
jgi:predicted metal-dependent TIM-barrel fold hydrolase